MSLDACAERVRRGDPLRFKAVLAAPRPDRPTLLAIYAFALELARAPQVTAEPMIAEMRLQWWRDALDEIEAGRTVRRHEIATPLAQVLPSDAVPLLRPAIDARRWDIGRAPHDDAAALLAYLDATAAAPARAVAAALGSARPGAVTPDARGWGYARYLAAVPALAASGRQPLPPGFDAARLARELADAPRSRIDRAARVALLETAGARAVLDRIARRPGVAEKGLELDTPRRRLALLAAALRNRA